MQYGYSSRQDKVHQLGDRLLASVVEPLSEGPVPIEQFLERRGVTNGRDINSIVELLLFSLFPIDVTVQQYVSEPDSETIRTYLRIALFSIVDETARRAGAVPIGGGSFEEQFKSRVNIRFNQYTVALNEFIDAPPTHRSWSLAQLACTCISGRPPEDIEAIGCLSTYFIS